MHNVNLETIKLSNNNWGKGKNQHVHPLSQMLRGHQKLQMFKYLII